MIVEVKMSLIVRKRTNKNTYCKSASLSVKYEFMAKLDMPQDKGP